MRPLVKLSAVALAVSSVISAPLYANEIAKDHKFDLNFRYRIESVEQSGFSEDALASTLRTRFSLNSQWSDNWSTLFELENVAEIFSDDFNAGAGQTPERSQYPVVADGETTELNQAYVTYQSGGLAVSLGRQRINIGDQRFVGGVGWRQDEQTYDALRVNSKLGNGDLTYAFVSRVNRIFDDSVPAGEHDHNTHLINFDMPMDSGKLSVFYFAIDNEDAAVLANRTFGVSYAGQYDKLSYNLSFATQSEAGDNPNDYSANYYRLAADYALDKVKLGGGLEVLGGDLDGGQGFTTSLATLHKFQGWADVFLATPTAGVEDFYLQASTQVSGFKLKAVYHDFSFDEGGGDIGSEFDFVVSRKINPKTTALFKFASFSGDAAGFADRDKWWLMFTYKL